MKTTLLREDLIKALSIANRFVPLKPTLPVLGNILLKSDKGTLEVSSTNLESSVYLSLPAKTEEDWEITIPAKILSDFVSSGLSKEVTLELDKESLKVSSGEFEGVISGIAASEFPKLPESPQESASFNYSEFQKAISEVVFAASVDSAKPILTGIYIGQDAEKTIIVATDGYRLAKKTLSTKYEFEQIVLPGKLLVEALKIAGEMEQTNVSLSVVEEQNQVILKGDNFQIASRLLDGTYPQFQGIIPSKFISEFTIDKAQFTAAIKATSVFARDVGNVVKLDVAEESISLSATTTQIGEATAKVSGTNKGENLKIAFNSRYLLDGLATFKGSQTELKFSGSLSAALITAPDNKELIYIVMPVKPQN